MAKKKTARVSTTEQTVPDIPANADDIGTTDIAPSGSNGDYQPTHDEIAEAAYFRHLNRGGSEGTDFDDWVEAERELKERRR